MLICSTPLFNKCSSVYITYLESNLDNHFGLVMFQWTMHILTTNYSTQAFPYDCLLGFMTLTADRAYLPLFGSASLVGAPALRKGSKHSSQVGSNRKKDKTSTAHFD